MNSGRHRKPKKDRRRRWKGKLILLSILCGILYFAEGRYGFFRLKSIDITPGVISEGIVWQAIPRDANRFWPAIFLHQASFYKKIEGFYPVESKLSLTGWGRYSVTIQPLEPFIYVSWNSMIWILSTNGRMWLANLPANIGVGGLKHPQRPILYWDSALPLPMDPERQMGDIYLSSLPVKKIRKWYETLEKTAWYDEIYCLMAKKVDGKPVVQLLLGEEKAITGEIIVGEDTSNWLPLSVALDEIFPGGEYKKPPGLIINATYSDMKFTVTEKRPK